MRLCADQSVSSRTSTQAAGERSTLLCALPSYEVLNDGFLGRSAQDLRIALLRLTDGDGICCALWR
jgi:hypothetical protein